MAGHPYADFGILGLPDFSRMITNLDAASGEHLHSLFGKAHNEDFKQLTGKNILIGTRTRAATEW